MFTLDVSAASAFVAGLFMFLAPCTLPLLPAYIGFISGIDPKQLSDPEQSYTVRMQILKNALAFVLGFTVVFTLFGALAGFAGHIAGPLRIWLGRIGGAIVIFFGLQMLGVFKIPALLKERRLSIGGSEYTGNAFMSFAVGSAFAFGWTPCVGPILGTILFLAGSKASAVYGMYLLFIFSLGLAVPFLLTALFYVRISGLITRNAAIASTVSIVGGLFLVGLGILLVLGEFGLTIEYGYRLLDGINYDRLLNYL